MTTAKLLRSAVITALFSVPAHACGAITGEYMPYVRSAAAQQGLDPVLVASVIWIESRFCQYEPGTRTIRTSPDGARGLGQLMPPTARDMGVNPDDPIQNIYGTARYLRLMYDTFRDWPTALAGYNAGPGNVRKAGGIPSWETYTYVYQVLGTYESLRTVKLP